MKKYTSLIAIWAGLVLVLLIAVVVPVLAQDAGSPDPSAIVYGWICSHPVIVQWALGIALSHSGLTVLSAFIKKAGITEDTPIVGPYVKWIRILGTDVKPPDSTIVSNAATILAKNDHPDAPAVARAAVDIKTASDMKAI